MLFTQPHQMSSGSHRYSIVNSIQKDNLKPVQSIAQDFTLLEDIKKNCKIELYKVIVPQEKLEYHMKIFDWRNKTQFPIVRTKSVNLKNPIHQRDAIYLQVFIEHCPIRLINIPEMSLGQSLYMLKQSMIGYERLYNRFGSFEIKENMIALNQKGHCRVWFNQNFSLNSFPKSIVSQLNMIQRIIQIIQNHSVDSKNSKKLFNVLKTCSSFLQALKAVDKFIYQTRVLVPKKFISLNSIKSGNKILPNYIEKFRLSQTSKGSQAKFIRFSIKSSYPNQVTTLEKSVNRSPRKDRSPNSSHIKRFKSQNRLLVPSNMKTSQGETAYSKSIRDIKTSKGVLSLNTPQSASFTPTNSNPCMSNTNSQFEQRWVENTSFIMGCQDPNSPHESLKQVTQKKQLSHSEAFKHPCTSLKDIANRKYSVNVAMKLNKTPSKVQYKNPQNEDYFTQFSSLLNRDDTKLKNLQEQDQIDDQMQAEHLNKILQNNGWNMDGWNVKGFLEQDKSQLKKSFHQKDNTPKEPPKDDGKLAKLGSLARRQIAMSILPEEVQQLF